MIATNAGIEAAIDQLDRLIVASYGRGGEGRVEGLMERRDRLHLLLLARLIERRKPVVNLERWRYGFKALEPVRQERQ
jgi:hypothetical protein